MKKWNTVLSKSAMMMAVLSIGASAWAIDQTKSLYPTSVLTVRQDIVFPQFTTEVQFKNGQMDASNSSAQPGEQFCVMSINQSVKPSEKLRIAKGTKLDLHSYSVYSAYLYSPKGTEVRIACYEQNKSGGVVSRDFTEETLKKSFGDIFSVQAAPGSVIDVRMERDTDQGMKEKLQDI